MEGKGMVRYGTVPTNRHTKGQSNKDNEGRRLKEKDGDGIHIVKGRERTDRLTHSHSISRVCHPHRQRSLLV